MRIKSISTKILMVALALSIASAALMAYLAYQESRKTYQPTTEKMLLEAAQSSAESISKKLTSGFAVSETLAQTIDAAQAKGITDRSVIQNMLFKVLDSHPELLGSYTVWEPNAFDGRDSQYANASCHDKTGRMLMYWNKGSGKLLCEPVVDYDCSTAQCDWYNLPRKNMRPTAIEPTSYVIGGNQIFVTSLMTPIVRAGQVPGSVGVDFTLNDIRADVGKLKPLPSSSATLISATGKVMAAPNKAMVEKPYPYNLPQILAATQAGKPYQFLQTIEGVSQYVTSVPVRIGNANERYSLILQAPQSEILSPLFALRNSLGLIGLLAAALLALALFFVLRRTVVRPINQAVGAASEIAQGNLSTQIPTGSHDETGVLLRSLDSMRTQLNDRIEKEKEITESIRRENDDLNNSVVDIMTNVARLAQKDLTVKVPVSENVTGAVSDAINMMTSSTARALGEVNKISLNVADSSTRVKERANTVQTLANESTNQANAASQELSATATALQEIGEQAQAAGQDAERAMAATSDALGVVGETVSGITASRDQIRETEKRVKRLAERSQEISSAVNIIGQIAERTSVLALNASMQAVAAGDAGRGFAVVADEVKRLAENSREASQQIAGLVSAIQADTAETLQAMNNTITQVVDITRLADRAGAQMADTRRVTEALAHSVQSIARTTQSQSQASQKLLTRAQELIAASQRTLEEIGHQRSDADNLSDSASALVQTVSGFNLPKTA